MTNPTSNFGWQMPTSSDLVTDLPADFETFGQAVDTSLADLKGGTTGQVLSKASNTDMDFTWVAQDDSNAIQNAIVDAKGDLIAASAADTPARLAVGNNGETLVADSSTATGLKWASNVWTDWTPTVTCQSGTLTTFTTGGSYFIIGKVVVYRLNISITTAGTGAGFLRATLPNTPNATFAGSSQEVAATGVSGTAQISSGDAAVYIAKYDNTSFIANSRNIVATGIYRIA